MDSVHLSEDTKKYPLSKVEMSLRTQKYLFSLLPENSLLNFKKQTDTITRTGCSTLNAKPWYGKEAQLKRYVFFFLLFSVSFAHASQNYKILVGEKHKARFHIPEDLFPCAAYKPGDHPGKSGKHELAHQCCNCTLAALLHQCFALYLWREVTTKHYERPSLRQRHLCVCSEIILRSSSAFSPLDKLCQAQMGC